MHKGIIKKKFHSGAEKTCPRVSRSFETMTVSTRGLFALVGSLGFLALVWTILTLALPGESGWTRHYPPPGIWLTGSLVVMSMVLSGLIMFGKLGSETLVNLGLVYEVIYSFVVSYGEISRPHAPGTMLDGLSLVCVIIVLFPMFVRTTAMKTRVASLVAATTGPLAALLYCRTHGLPVPNGGLDLLAYMPNYVVVWLVMKTTRTMQRLTAEVSRAQKMGSYELTERLGMGGMGEVWKASHAMLRRPAAIKLIKAEALGPGSDDGNAVIRRFEREAQATAELHSPHTIQLYDFGVTEDGTLYYVMELLEGFNVKTLVDRFGPQLPERTVHILRQACHSLWDAHSSDLIHRDIKPANIYLCRYGHEVDHVKVLDFGLVKPTEQRLPADSGLTQAGVIAGTPGFIAPELALGGEIDARADLYALGCVGYWLLTGSPVFDHDTPMKMVLAHVQEKPIPPSERSEMSIPASLERILLSCLEKDPAKRPQTAHELRQQLSDCSCASEWTRERADAWWSTHSPAGDEVATSGPSTTS